MWATIGTVICGIITLMFIMFRWKIRHILRDTKNMVEIKSLFGIILSFIGKTNEEILKIMSPLFMPSWTDPIKFWLGPVFVVVVGNVNDIEAIMNSPNCIDKHYVYNFFDSNGLFSATSKIWKPDRKILNPTFNLKILQTFIPIFRESSKLMVKNIEIHAENENFDVSDPVLEYAFNSICRTELGYDIEVLKNKNIDCLTAIKKACVLIAERVCRVWLHPDFIYKKTLQYKQEQIYKEKFYTLSQRMIDARRIERNNSSKDDANKNEDDDLKKPKVFLNHLLDLAEDHHFTDTHVKDHVNTMIFAGTETTAYTISYILMMLGNYPDIQERVFQEIQEHYSSDDDIDNTTLSKLVYMEMVIKETMRLYPIIPFIARVTTGDVKLKNYNLPAGVSLLISYYHLHRDPNVWGPNAEKFNPDNFLPENMRKRNPNSFGGFSLGLRNCIGRRYAMMSMKILISEFLLAYKISTKIKPEHFRNTFDLTLKLLNGYKISIEKRSK